MGLLGQISKYVANVGLLEISIKALDKVIPKLEERSEESTNKLFEKLPGTGILVINRHQSNWKDKFDVYDENRDVKYTVKGKHRWHIYDSKGNEIGTVTEKRTFLRSPISLNLHPIDFIIKIGAKKVATIQYRLTFGKRNYKIDFNNWRIDGNVFGWKYKIFNGNEEIANVSQKLLHFGDTYVINFSEPKNELVLLMLVIALDASKQPEEIKKPSLRQKWSSMWDG